MVLARWSGKKTAPSRGFFGGALVAAEGMGEMVVLDGDGGGRLFGGGKEKMRLGNSFYVFEGVSRSCDGSVDVLALRGYVGDEGGEGLAVVVGGVD